MNNKNLGALYFYLTVLKCKNANLKYDLNDAKFKFNCNLKLFLVSVFFKTQWPIPVKLILRQVPYNFGHKESRTAKLISHYNYCLVVIKTIKRIDKLDAWNGAFHLLDAPPVYWINFFENLNNKGTLLWNSQRANFMYIIPLKSIISY